MKGKARKIGRPPPGDPPTPAAEALAPVGADAGAFDWEASSVGVQRGAGFALRWSCRVAVDAPLSAAPGLRRPRRSSRGGVRRGRPAALGAEGDQVAGRGEIAIGFAAGREVLGAGALSFPSATSTGHSAGLRRRAAP